MKPQKITSPDVREDHNSDDNKPRVETGALQINDDWRGLFVRGDDCFTLENILEAFLQHETGYLNFHHAMEIEFARELLKELETVRYK